MRNIDWSSRTFDFYVDDALVGGAQPFATSAGSQVSRIDIYNITGDSALTFWDEFDIRP
jgi:hypothetical protein